MYCFISRRVTVSALVSWTAISLLCALPSPAAASPIEARLAEVITNNRRCAIRACRIIEATATEEPAADATPAPVAFTPPPEEEEAPTGEETPAAEAAHEPALDSTPPLDLASTSGAFAQAQISPILAFAAASVGGAMLAIF